MPRPIDLEQMKDQLKSIDLEIKSPKPTPPVGTPVVWYPRARVDEANQIAAVVTKVDGPGKVSLTVFRPQGMPDPTKRGCLHVSDPIHEQRHNSVSMNSGAWDYPDGVNTPKAHLELHLDALQKKRDSVEEQLKNATEIDKKQNEKTTA